MPYPLIIFKNICKKLDLILWSTIALISSNLRCWQNHPLIDEL